MESAFWGIAGELNPFAFFVGIILFNILIIDLV